MSMRVKPAKSTSRTRASDLVNLATSISTLGANLGWNLGSNLGTQQLNGRRT